MKYDFADAHLTFELEDRLKPMRLMRSKWNARQLSEQLGVPFGSIVSWQREDDPEEIIDLLFAGWPVFKVREPSGDYVYALPKEVRENAAREMLRVMPVGGNA